MQTRSVWLPPGLSVLHIEVNALASVVQTARVTWARANTESSARFGAASAALQNPF